jgi:transposase
VEQSYRSILGILRLANRFGDDRLEAACRRALLIKAYNYRSIESILKKGLDGLELETINEPVDPVHGNVRGAHYFH